MATETSLERQRRLAAENDEFETWRQAYRAEQDMAREWGGGLINGVPAALVVPNDPTGDRTRQPLPGREDRDRAARTAALGDPERVMRNADRIRAQTVANQEVANLDRQARYNAFLADQGIDPDTIGGARVTASGLQAPSLAQQQAAREASNQYNRERTDLRLAANNLARRGNRAAAAELRGQADYLYPQIGGRSSEARMDYWLNRLSPTNYQTTRMGLPANGFGRPVDYNTAAVSRFGTIG